MTTFVTITNAEKGKPIRLSQTIDNTNRNLKIGLKSISGRVGWYNIDSELNWYYTHQGGDPSDAIKVFPGLYSFEELTKEFSSQIDGLEFEVDEKTGKIAMTIPEEYQIWFPDRVLEMFGLDDRGWLTAGDYEGDHSIEFAPQRILVYLKQLSTTGNITNFASQNLSGSQLLGFIPIPNSDFGEHFFTVFEKPNFKSLQTTSIYEIDLDFKIEWRSNSIKLNNHEQPLNFELIIK